MFEKIKYDFDNVFEFLKYLKNNLGIINYQPRDNILCLGFDGDTIYEMIKNKHLYGLIFQIGYKSSGYSIGEQLHEGVIIRGGVSFQLNKDK